MTEFSKGEARWGGAFRGHGGKDKGPKDGPSAGVAIVLALTSLFTDKVVRSERMVELRQGEPLLFGKDHDKGIAFDEHFQPYLVDGDDLDKAYVWDEAAASPAAAMALATMDESRIPVPIGVFRRQEKANYEQAVNLQVEHAKSATQQSLADLLYSGEIWEVS